MSPPYYACWGLKNSKTFYPLQCRLGEPNVWLNAVTYGAYSVWQQKEYTECLKNELSNRNAIHYQTIQGGMEGIQKRWNPNEPLSITSRTSQEAKNSHIDIGTQNERSRNQRFQ
jgi:hypothetical protein